MISVSKIKLSELIVFLDNSKLSTRNIIPLSRHKAISLMVNPRARNNDTIVYLAYYNDKVIGFHTILPDTININGQISRAAWLSASWVSPDYMNKGVAHLLLNEIINDWDGRVLANNFAPLARQIISKSDKFSKLYVAQGKRFYLRKTYLKDYNTAKYSSFFDKFMEKLINFFNFSALTRKWLVLPKNIELEYFTRPDSEMVNMYNLANKNTLTRRTEDEWNWMLRFPWLQAAPLGDRISPKYFFASAPPEFNQYTIKVFAHDELIAMLHIQHSHTRLTVPYSYFEPKYSQIVAKVVLLHAHKLKATFIATYNHDLINGLNKYRSYFMYTTKRTREFLATNELISQIGGANFTFSDGDGDCGFI